MDTPDSSLRIQQIGKDAVSALAETMKSIADRELVAVPMPLRCSGIDSFVTGLPAAIAVVRCALDQDFAGKYLHIAMPVVDAITLAGLMMMSPEGEILQRREQGTLQGEDLEAYGEVGAMLCKAVEGVLGEGVAKAVGAAMENIQTIEPGSAKRAKDTLGSGEFVVLPFNVKVGEFPESSCCLLIDSDTAETWNGGPLGVEVAGSLMPGETPFDQIPAAEIRGKLAAFITRSEVLDVVRRSCRRLGLEIQRHGRSEIPNPAAHRNQIVLMDVPTGDERRFEWARRLKGYDGNTGVVLLLQQPSKAQVLQGFLAKADQIAGWPVTESVLSKKLGTVMDTVYGVPEDE